MLNDIKFFDSLTHIKQDKSWYRTDKVASFETLKQYHEHEVLTNAVIAAMPDDDYEYISKTVRQHLPFCSLVYSVKKEWLTKSDSEIKSLFTKLKLEHGAVGIKVHPRFSKIDIQSEQLPRIAHIAATVGLFVYICTIFRKPVGPVTHTIHFHLANLCETCPKTQFVFLHGGYTDLFAMGEIIRDYPNALLDLSFTFMRFRKSSLSLDVGYLFETLDQKLTIGTDFPEYTPSQLKTELNKYVLSRDDLNLSIEKIENVLFNNMNKLVRTYE